MARLVEADRKTVKAAIEAARAAFPGWSERPYADRVTAMRQFARELERRKYQLAMAAMFEVGKSRLEAVGESEEAVDLLDWYCDEMERNRGFERPMSRAMPREETVCRLRPVGTFAVIAPFNFPVALACNMLGACLIAGNTAVFKPAPGAGLTASLILEAARAAALPDGVLDLVCGEATGEILVDAPGLDGVAFTGSHEVGMKIFRKFAASPHMRPVIAEIGGKIRPMSRSVPTSMPPRKGWRGRPSAWRGKNARPARSSMSIGRSKRDSRSSKEQELRGIEDWDAGRQGGVHWPGDR